LLSEKIPKFWGLTQLRDGKEEPADELINSFKKFVDFSENDHFESCKNIKFSNNKGQADESV